MEEERINLSQRERDRLRVLHELEEGHLQQKGSRAALATERAADPGLPDHQQAKRQVQML